MPTLLLATCDHDAIIRCRPAPQRKRRTAAFHKSPPLAIGCNPVHGFLIWLPESVKSMRELIKTTDIVLLSRVGALLDAHNLNYHVFDTHMSILEGSIGAIPRRVMVVDDDFAPARRLMGEAGLAAELSRG